MDLECSGRIFLGHRPFQKHFNPHVVRFAATPIVNAFWRNLHAPDAFHLNEARHFSVLLCHPANLQGGRSHGVCRVESSYLLGVGTMHATKKVRLWNR